jgi:predicted helicase
MIENIFKDYIQSVSSKFAHEETTEMGYRTDFEILLKEIFKSINVTRFDHDARAKEGNKPDFVVVKNSVPILYIETKNIGTSLDRIEKSEQMRRYYGYTNIVLTDYLEFRFYRNGLYYVEPIKVAEYDLKTRKITPITNNYEYLARTLTDFTQSQKEPIKSGEHLAKIMGGKAQRIRDNIQQFFTIELEKDTDLSRLYETLKKLLVHDLSKKSFADMYAQTLVYGLFVARYYDKTLGSFSRHEARELIPNSNPFLRHFFDHIVGADFDTRFKYIVDELCEIFSHANVAELVKQYFKTNLSGEIHQEKDPVIHFYEDFLEEYDPVLRKKMGAYYTPPPVVQFIVHSVDCLLKKEFDLFRGIADDSKTKDNVHKVQILDPAVGTGTFISAIISVIYERLLENGQKGRWPAYVHHDLLPRIYGFELMMTPYTIAHLKLGIAFRQTGFWDFHRRLGIYLTNSLEESYKQQELFAFGLAESIAEESKEAAIIKNKKPIMVVIGNPPYFGESSNKNYTGHSVYKFEPSGEKLREKNSKWINDDYVKFIRFAENMIEENSEGIVAMITAHGYIDNPTFRGMRWHLMKTFDDIFILDLHGNANKRETAPDGTVDKNVFDIKQGVAIFIGIRKSNSQKKSFAKIHRADILGSRDSKFMYLNKNTVDTIKWQKINPFPPNYEWIKINKRLKDKYEQGFSINEIFKLKNTGIVTKRDKLCIQETHEKMWQAVQDFINLAEAKVRQIYEIQPDVRDWKYKWAKEDLFKSGPLKEKIIPISYRPFDDRCIYYTGRARGFVGWPVERITKHFIQGKNIGLVTGRTDKNPVYSSVFISKNMSETKLGESSTQSYIFPLYTYFDNNRMSNFDNEIIDNLKKLIGKTTPEDILNYIYAVLYSPNYRNKYKKFLKMDFPRVPYPKDRDTFEKLVKFGQELKELHLLESPIINKFITSYPIAGSDTIDKQPTYKSGKVYINDKQYFGNVPEVAWNFYIGGYQPSRKWLKDRKGRKLTNSELEHYQKIIVALTETNKIMQEIDKILNDI